jgi:hypothetical protein
MPFDRLRANGNRISPLESPFALSLSKRAHGQLESNSQNSLAAANAAGAGSHRFQNRAAVYGLQEGIVL